MGFAATYEGRREGWEPKIDHPGDLAELSDQERAHVQAIVPALNALVASVPPDATFDYQLSGDQEAVELVFTLHDVPAQPEPPQDQPEWARQAEHAGWRPPDQPPAPTEAPPPVTG